VPQKVALTKKMYKTALKRGVNLDNLIFSTTHIELGAIILYYPN